MGDASTTLPNDLHTTPLCNRLPCAITPPRGASPELAKRRLDPQVDRSDACIVKRAWPQHGSCQWYATLHTSTNNSPEFPELAKQAPPNPKWSNPYSWNLEHDTCLLRTCRPFPFGIPSALLSNITKDTVALRQIIPSNLELGTYTERKFVHTLKL